MGKGPTPGMAKRMVFAVAFTAALFAISAARKEPAPESFVLMTVKVCGASELSPRVGVRFVTVDALHDPDSIYDTAGFYARFGFAFADGEGRRVPGQPFRAMYYDLKPILDAIASV